MKIISWNVNGIRSIFKTTFKNLLQETDPDIICLQETKADHGDLSGEYTQIDGYWSYFNSSSLRKGHSGVAVYTKIKPLTVETKLGIERFDDEGRCLKLTFNDFVLYNFYIPNGGRDKHDIPYKLEVYKKLLSLFEAEKEKEVILVGDFNIAHKEIDVYHAKQNVNNTMFTPEERKQIDALLNLGYVDTFRKLFPDKRAYSWWPYMGELRANDIGWRIDYIFISKKLEPFIENAATHRETPGSDHGAVSLVLNKKIEIGERPILTKTKPNQYIVMFFQYKKF